MEYISHPPPQHKVPVSVYIEVSTSKEIGILTKEEFGSEQISRHTVILDLQIFKSRIDGEMRSEDHPEIFQGLTLNSLDPRYYHLLLLRCY